MIARGAARIAPFDRDTARAGHQHAVDAQATSFDVFRHAERLEAGQGSRVDRVAAQLVTRKRGAVDEPHARAGARQHERGDRTRGARTHNQHIKHRVIWLLVNLVIW